MSDEHQWRSFIFHHLIVHRRHYHHHTNPVIETRLPVTAQASVWLTLSITTEPVIETRLPVTAQASV